MNFLRYALIALVTGLIASCILSALVYMTSPTRNKVKLHNKAKIVNTVNIY